MEMYKNVECRRIDADLLSVVDSLSVQPLTQAELRVIQADIYDVVKKRVPFASVRAVIIRMLLPGRNEHPAVYDADDESTERGVSDKQLVQSFARAAGLTGYSMDEFCHRAYLASEQMRESGILAHEFKWHGDPEYKPDGKVKTESLSKEKTLVDQIRFFEELQKKAAEKDLLNFDVLTKYSDQIVRLAERLEKLQKMN
jgi:hypothetical protein